MKHALVIGGSGMLANACLWLADNGYRVSVVGRDRSRLDRLAQQNDNIIPISADYNEDERFRKAIRQSIAAHGPYELVVAWIHSNDITVIEMISEQLNSAKDFAWRIHHLLGSRENAEEKLQEIAPLGNGQYCQIQLGFVLENGKSRWMTHDEISNGVIQAIREGASRHLIGTLEPASMNPWIAGL